MKDDLMLLAAGIICALLAWVFYHFVGEYAVSIFLTIILISILAKSAKSKFGHSNNKN